MECCLLIIVANVANPLTPKIDPPNYILELTQACVTIAKIREVGLLKNLVTALVFYAILLIALAGAEIENTIFLILIALNVRAKE